jgi:hypothetical protein
MGRYDFRNFLNILFAFILNMVFNIGNDPANSSEHAMAQTNHPSKELVRNWMQQRQGEHRPPPTLDEVRRQLGWELVEAERVANEPREQR